MSSTEAKIRVACAVLALGIAVAPLRSHAGPPPHAPGSLINPDNYQSLVADRRAHQVGDTLTVLIVETASASASANTTSDSGTQISGQLVSPHFTHNYGLGLSGGDAGQGETTRAGILQAQLAVRVMAVESDGLLRVRGEQTVIINGERQRIALSGLVREADILSSNEIPSDRISDAKIEFTGHGDVTRAQRRSFIYRFLKWLRIL